MDKKKALEAFLIQELKEAYHVKSFVKEWRELGIDVGDVRVIDKLLIQNELLVSMISLYNWGLINKVLELKQTLKV